MTSSRSRLISTVAKKIRAVAQTFGGCPSEVEEERKIEKDPEVLLWLKGYSLDLPPHISQDRSELDYLRRKNYDALLGIDSDILEDEIGYLIRKRSEALLVTNPNIPEDRIGYLIRKRSGSDGTLIGIDPNIQKDENKNLQRYRDAAIAILYLEQQPGKNHDYALLCISIRGLEKDPSFWG
ncbi:hypothetical protein LZ554_005311 [Drepanopeziza brunnea f. sp. 'monogermtubi']|nr:hypothetical protein LZ554_005311 [Drepanopeziza brunnea f. sp. 'monogermtubi']